MCGICGIFYSQSGIFRTLRLWDQKGLDRDAQLTSLAGYLLKLQI
jgi:hypothetical protein